MKIYPTFASRHFVSGQQVKFTVYKYNGQIVCQKIGNEIAHTGVYYIELNLNFGLLFFDQVYLVIAEELNGCWKSVRSFSKKDVF